MSKKLTPWFPPTVKPPHVGVYEVILLVGSRDFDQVRPDGFAYWNGRSWGWNSDTADFAATSGNVKGSCQAKKWRGLAVKP